MSTDPNEKERAELLSRAVDLLNEGKAKEADELIQRSGDLGKSVLPHLEVHKMFSGLPPVPEEQMEKNFARARKEYERHAVERAFKEALETGGKLSLERRSDFLILLIHFAKEVWGNMRLVKLLFLLRNEGEAVKNVGDFYSHYAYNFGAFDEDILKDVKALKKLGVLEKKNPPEYVETEGILMNMETIEPVHVDGIYELTPRGEKVAQELLQSAEKKHPGVIKDIQSIVEKYGRMNIDKLLAYTYKKYPDYAKNSKVKNEYLK